MSEAVPNAPKNQVGAGQQPGIELLAAIVASSGDAIVSLDLEGYITCWNSAARHLFGFTPQEAIGIHAAFLLWPAHLRRQAIRSIDQLKGGAGPFHYESQLKKKDGTLVAVSVTAFGVRNAAGELIGIAAIYRDISRFFATARDVGQQKELERERSLLASIVNSSDEAIYSEAPDGTVNSWNGGAEKLFGYSATEIVGRNITLCIPQERRAESLKHLRRVLRKEGIQQFQTVRRRKDGGLVDVSITMSPIIDSAGAVSGLAVIARDITQRRQFEEQLTKARDEALEAARLKSEFLANMSHEIRTPLNSMVGLGAMLLDTKLGVEQQALVREMQDTNEGLLAIINDILDFSKMSVGKLIFEVVDFELEKVIAATLSLLAAPSRKKGLEVAMWIEPGTPKILRGDPGRLRQVLANLVSNAVKYTEQ
ncbi:MAG TPA: PAS domain S-box protein, partial [Candidatus Binataceae bacterium]